MSRYLATFRQIAALSVAVGYAASGGGSSPAGRRATTCGFSARAWTPAGAERWSKPLLLLLLLLLPLSLLLPLLSKLIISRKFAASSELLLWGASSEGLLWQREPLRPLMPPIGSSPRWLWLMWIPAVAGSVAEADADKPLAPARLEWRLYRRQALEELASGCPVIMR